MAGENARAYNARGRAWVMGDVPRGQKSTRSKARCSTTPKAWQALGHRAGLRDQRRRQRALKLKEAVAEQGYELDLIDLEAVATVLDRPHIHADRLKYLDIGATFELDVDVTVSGGSAWAVIDDAAVREHLLGPRPPRRPEPSIRSAPPPALLAALLHPCRQRHPPRPSGNRRRCVGGVRSSATGHRPSTTWPHVGCRPWKRPSRTSSLHSLKMLR